MKNALVCISEIRAAIQKSGCVVMLDFDGTLSPIVQKPKDAVIPVNMRRLLSTIAQRFPVAIISGRSLSDVTRRVGLRGICYAGEHGHEWRIGKKSFRRAIPAKSLATLHKAQAALLPLLAKYPKLIAEKKRSSFALNYRALAPAHRRAFQNAALKAVAPLQGAGAVRLIDSQYTFEILADTQWTKGDVARRIYRAIGGRASRAKMPIFIGDSLTDEDAFKEFRRGITIRVGKSSSSAARYFLQSQKDVERLLRELLSLDV